MMCSYVDGHLLIQTVLYFTIVVTGLATAISSNLAKSNFGEQCILYGSSNCSYNSSYYDCQFTSGPSSICSFITGATIFVCIFYAFANGCYHAYAVHRSRVIIRVASQMWLRTLLFGTILALLVTLVAACTLAVGMQKWCDSVNTPAATTTLSSTTSSTTTPTTPTTVLTTPSTTTLSSTTPNVSLTTSGIDATVTPPLTTTVLSTTITTAKALQLVLTTTATAIPLPSCSLMPGAQWYDKNRNIYVDAGNYYYSFSVAESSCWACVVFWFIQLFFYIHRLYKASRQRQQTSYQDPFTADDAFDVFT